MPPKAGPAGRTGGKATAKKPAKPKEVDILEALQTLKAEKAEREARQETNPILIRLKKRDDNWRPSRAKKKVKIPAEEMEGVLEALIKIQAWSKMVNERWRYKRVRSKMIDVKERRLVRPEGTAMQVTNAGETEAEEVVTDEVEENPILKQLLAYRKMKEVETDRPFQKAALILQAWARSHYLRQHLIDQVRAVQSLSWVMTRKKPRLEHCREAAVRVIHQYLIQRPARHLWISTWVGWKVAQACARRNISACMERNRSLRVREIFHRAVRAQRMWLFRAIWVRRDAIIVAQAAARRVFANVHYIDAVTKARAAARTRRERKEAAVLLSNQLRMRIHHETLHDYVAKVNLLRRTVRSRTVRWQFERVCAAASDLGRHARAVSAQLSGRRLALRMPLLRFVQAEPQSQDLVKVAQSLCRVWCMEAMGQADAGGFEGEGRQRREAEQRRVERAQKRAEKEKRKAERAMAMALAHAEAKAKKKGQKAPPPEPVLPPPEEGEESEGEEDDLELQQKEEPSVQIRLHLSHQQKREAAKELQAAVRRTLASSADERLTVGQSFGYARLLVAGARSQATVRSWNVRRIITDLMRQYGAMQLQAMCRMKAGRIAMCNMFAAETTAVYTIRRAMENRHYLKTFGAQIVLQSMARMRATPVVQLPYSRMPARELAKIMQAKCRRVLARNEYVAKVDGVLGWQALVRKSLARTMYLASRAWMKRVKAQGKEAHGWFGSLVSMHPRGQALWRTRRYVERKEKWTGGESVRPTEATEKQRTEERQRVVKAEDDEREQVEAAHRKAGLLLRVDLAVGTGKVVNHGRLARVFSRDCVMLDPRSSSRVAGEYRHFFLQNGGESRRIVKYEDHIAIVEPRFSVRPVVNTQYWVVDEEYAPYERNLVKERREREAAAALALQMAWRQRAARKILREELRFKWQEEARVAALEEEQRRLYLEMQEAKRKREAEEAERRRAAAEGRRMLMEAMEKAEAERRAKRAEVQARKERLWGLTPKFPVLPARARSREARPSSREARSVPASPAPSAPPPREKPAGDESFRRRRLSARSAEGEWEGAELRDVVARRLFEDGERSRDESEREREREAALRPPRSGRAVRRKVAPKEEGKWVGVQFGDVVIGDVSSAFLIRKEVRDRTHSLYVDMNPPDFDDDTTERLRALEEELEAGQIDAEEHAVRRWAVVREWKHSPKTSPRTSQPVTSPFDSSPKKDRPNVSPVYEDVFEHSR